MIHEEEIPSTPIQGLNNTPTLPPSQVISIKPINEILERPRKLVRLGDLNGGGMRSISISSSSSSSLPSSTATTPVIPQPPPSQASFDAKIQQLQLIYPQFSTDALSKRLIQFSGDFNATVQSFNKNKQMPVTKKQQRPRKRVIQESPVESPVETTVAIDLTQLNTSQEEEANNIQDYQTATEFFNTATKEELAEMTGCSVNQAELVLANRPFRAHDYLVSFLNNQKGISQKILDNYIAQLERFQLVDGLIEKCRSISNDLQESINNIKVAIQQPQSVNQQLRLKPYQLLGLNWLNLLHEKKLSGILANDMGLGKTAQIISFLSHLKDIGTDNKSLVIVPSSTVDNWSREFNRWSSCLRVEVYQGSQREREELREELDIEDIDVIVTSYNTIQAKEDRQYLRRLGFNYLILDEGHLVKNINSQRYKHLMSIKTEYRILMTGTPLQNNLHELISLLIFIMPDLFKDDLDTLSRVFQKGLVSDMRIQKAKLMMKPFILRRRKVDVLQELPPKTEEIVKCEATESQMKEYNKILATGNLESNVLMQLRKMACHPLLHRVEYTDAKLEEMASQMVKYIENGRYDYILEDMKVMSDAELNRLCKDYKGMNKYILPEERLIECGKIIKLLELLKECQANGDRVLLFSQFTMMLDILELVLQRHSYSYLRMDGQTQVTERQPIIDLYQDGEQHFVFLLSTKAGGFGINLTAANVVILYDLDFNPHNDKQAEDRAHRVGQERDVRVYKMITKDTIEESIYDLGVGKIDLDKSVSENMLIEAEKRRLERVERLAANE